ncbi:MAG: methyltransferase [Acidobacteria bacterium]|nr:methyltransferase [Acidobacteriota bacterium]
MKQVTEPQDVLELMNAGLAAAALNAALELGVFGELKRQPQSGAELAQTLGMPLGRCVCWLDVLTELGLLARADETYAVTPVAQAVILDMRSQSAWALQAELCREPYQRGVNLASHLKDSGPVWAAQGRAPLTHYEQVSQQSDWAERFTRMIYELHGPLAAALAETIELNDAQRMLDVGGGSGVMSLALLKRNPQLKSVVVDVANVCRVGRALADATPEANRISYHAADFLRDELPSGFDLVLECDIQIYSDALFRKFHAALNPSGRLVLIDRWWAQADGRQPAAHALHAFAAALEQPDRRNFTVAEIQTLSAAAGFEPLAVRTLATGETLIEVMRCA